ncbi:hypothetical protein E1287_35055 [Actinomadura sp. KC06]|nr:hypothetical protein E1287_35055 [Actinomadura sp. KC06]
MADAGMISEANKRAIEQAGLSFILGARISEVPYVVKRWRRDHPDAEIGDGHVFTQHWPADTTENRRDQVIYYQYRAVRARRTLRGTDQQVAKAEAAVAGRAPVKRNRFIQLSGADKSVKRSLEAKARALAGLKGLTIVFAALAVSRWIERATGWSIKKFVTTARRYRTVQIAAGDHALTAADLCQMTYGMHSNGSTVRSVRTNLRQVRKCGVYLPEPNGCAGDRRGVGGVECCFVG